ncbi:hypothetical protein [Bacteroides ovatus]|uniref:hypothetical protein n=1 Tax=Bacteroides ovatus TaxID=28116 RepID=UPI0012DB349E|nr:hypothetical protein [Bacteroides ovatus]
MRGSLQFLCDYFGITRQGYYKHVNRKMEIDILTSSIVLYCNELRKLMPKAGMRELYACCLRKFGVRYGSLDVINAIIFFVPMALSTCQTCEAKDYKF